MAEYVSELRTLMPCPLCGRSLIPAPVESSIIFHCKSGHELALEELLRARSAVLKCGLEILLAEWSRQHQAMIHTIVDARKNGFLDVAEIYSRRAKSLESRIDKVLSAFLQSESSKRINVTDSLRLV